MLGLKKRELWVWFGYILMLCTTIPWHEPWNDEAQAWLLARDLGLRELIFNALRYESHPPLWYLILWLPAHLHVSYLALSWISGGIAAAGIYFMLRYAPFPFYLRAALPFTYFLAYQYAVVARSYVLFPLLGFAAAYAYRAMPRRPVLLAVLLGLLANVSVHGTLLTCTIAAIYGWDLWVERKDPNAISVDTNKLLLAGGILAVSLALVAMSVRPPRDLVTVATPTVTRMLRIEPSARAGEIPNPPPATDVHAAAPVQQGGVRYRVRQVPNVASYAITRFKLLALLLYAIAALYLYRRKNLLLLLPIFVMLLFLAFVYAREWHLGLLWITLLMVLWISWDATETDRSMSLQNVLAGLLLAICILQFPWTFRAIRYDIRFPYSGSKTAAEYLKTLDPGMRIAGFTPEVTGILPYFNRNIFFNQPAYGYWLWSTRNKIDADAADAISTHPDAIVLLRKTDASADDPPMWQYALDQGYVETHRFCGRLYLPNANVAESCYLVLQPETGPKGDR